MRDVFVEVEGFTLLQNICAGPPRGMKIYPKFRSEVTA